jgi:DNA uptake protein ComE-like DNA-binding protein
VWALAPLFTCGFATPFTMGYGAYRAKSTALALCAVIYALGLFTFLLGAAGAENDFVALLASLGLFGNWAGGTAHSFIVRSRVFGLRKPPQTANERAIAMAQHRRNLRQEARELAKNDPGLAKELRIGRPDLPRQYDDGGLVDVNHAPAEVIATIPGITPELAQKIVEVRDTVGAFISAEELSATVGLPPHLTSDLAEYTIYLD